MLSSRPGLVDDRPRALGHLASILTPIHRDSFGWNPRDDSRDRDPRRALLTAISAH